MGSIWTDYKSIDYLKSAFVEWARDTLDEFNSTTKDYFCVMRATEREYNGYILKFWKCRRIRKELRSEILKDGQRIKLFSATPEEAIKTFFDIATK